MMDLDKNLIDGDSRVLVKIHRGREGTQCSVEGGSRWECRARSLPHRLVTDGRTYVACDTSGLVPGGLQQAGASSA